MPARPVILLTGFGPFPGIPANATSVLVPKLAAAAAEAFPGNEIECRVLPTEWHEGLVSVADLYGALRPVVALHFGVARRAVGFEIETRGRNRCNATKDAAGCLPADACLTPEGPDYLPATLPAQLIVERLRRRGIPASVSRDAGGYLCNALLYRTQEMARIGGAPQRSGFIHVPAGLVNERNPGRGPLPSCRLTWRDMIEGGVEIIAACLGRAARPFSSSRHHTG